MRNELLAACGFALFLVVVFPAQSTAAEDVQKVIIPFDFVSKFDNGRYGQMVGELIWKKLEREGGFILPESMQDVRDYCQSHHIQVSPDISLAKMGKIVQDDFGAQIGIWGSVERAPGAEGEIYELALKCVDFSAQPEPKVIYQTKSRTNSVSEIPHLYVKQMLDALYNRQPGAPASADVGTEKNWEKNPNLVEGGDFQTGTNGVPKGWEAVAGQKREPLGNLVRWESEEGSSQNKVIRFVFDSQVGDNEGVMYYSDWFPVEEGAKYRFQCRWRTSGPAVKVFIKCYDEVKESYQTGAAAETDTETAHRLGKDKYPSMIRRREVYRSQQNLQGPKNAWNTHTEDFTPKHTKYSPKWGRVMLYAYLGGGQVEFDDVTVKQISPPLKAQNKEPRHSLETKITIKEMEENERRSKEAKEKDKNSGD
jgi:hypothetical protein